MTSSAGFMGGSVVSSAGGGVSGCGSVTGTITPLIPLKIGDEERSKAVRSSLNSTKVYNHSPLPSSNEIILEHRNYNYSNGLGELVKKPKTNAKSNRYKGGDSKKNSPTMKSLEETWISIFPGNFP